MAPFAGLLTPPAPARSGARAWVSSTDRPSDTNDLRLTTAEAHLSEGDIQSGCAFHLHLEVIGKDRDPLEELLHEDPALVIAGVVPCAVEIEVSKQASHLLEAPEQLLTLRRVFPVPLSFLSDG